MQLLVTIPDKGVRPFFVEAVDVTPLIIHIESLGVQKAKIHRVYMPFLCSLIHYKSDF